MCPGLGLQQTWEISNNNAESEAGGGQSQGAHLLTPTVGTGLGRVESVQAHICDSARKTFAL